MKMEWKILRLVLKDILMKAIKIIEDIVITVLIIVTLLAPIIISEINPKYTWIGFIPYVGLLLLLLYWGVEEQYKKKVKELENGKDL